MKKETVEQRSYVMSQIKKKNTKPELIVRRFLFKNGFRFRIHVKKMPGNPDIVLQKYKTVIFVNGCFWHAHENCKLNRMPKTRVEYWIPKINGNVERDKEKHRQLREQGFTVIVIWECELRKNSEIALNRLIANLKVKDKNT